MRIGHKKLNFLREFALSSDHMNRQLSARDHRMARTICTICLGYLFCNVPVIVIKLVRGNDTDDIPYVRLVASCLYFMQYRLVQLDLAPGRRVFLSCYILRCHIENEARKTETT